MARLNPSHPRRTAARTRFGFQPRVLPKRNFGQISAPAGAMDTPAYDPYPTSWDDFHSRMSDTDFADKMTDPTFAETVTSKLGPHSMTPPPMSSPAIPAGAAGVKTDTMVSSPSVRTKKGHWTDKYFDSGAW